MKFFYLEKFYGYKELIRSEYHTPEEWAQWEEVEYDSVDEAIKSFLGYSSIDDLKLEIKQDSKKYINIIYCNFIGDKYEFVDSDVNSRLEMILIPEGGAPIDLKGLYLELEKVSNEHNTKIEQNKEYQEYLRLKKIYG